jgi:hypothetical protein
MKRVYWFLGGGTFLLGVCFFVAPFFEEDAPARTEAVTKLAEKPQAVVQRELEPTVEVAKKAPLVQQEVNALYASTAPKAEVVEEERPDVLADIEEATLVRKPVIDAIRLLNVSKADKYERMREALRNSGDSVEAWTRQASDVFVGWEQKLEGKGGANLDAGSVRCYLAGCEAQVYFENEAEYEAAAAGFRTISEGDTAHGGRVQTPPKQLEDGRWVAAWMMMRPDVGVE